MYPPSGSLHNSSVEVSRFDIGASFHVRNGFEVRSDYVCYSELELQSSFDTQERIASDHTPILLVDLRSYYYVGESSFIL